MYILCQVINILPNFSKVASDYSLDVKKRNARKTREPYQNYHLYAFYAYFTTADIGSNDY